MDIRRVVTGRDEAGRSIVVSDEPAPVLEVLSAEHAPDAYWLLWGTDDTGAAVSDAPMRPEPGVPAVAPFFPGTGGTRFLLLEYAPGSSTPSPGVTPAAARADREAKLHGTGGAYDPDTGMHTTDTVDYGMCLAGELWLELDDDEAVHLTPGTVVIQRGTRHRWRNRGAVPALMMFVMIGAERR